jgi:hypothetical protein
MNARTSVVLLVMMLAVLAALFSARPADTALADAAATAAAGLTPSPGPALA